MLSDTSMPNSPMPPILDLLAMPQSRSSTPLPPLPDSAKIASTSKLPTVKPDRKKKVIVLLTKKNLGEKRKTSTEPSSKKMTEPEQQILSRRLGDMRDVDPKYFYVCIISNVLAVIDC
jgi:hypothetical protein